MNIDHLFRLIKINDSQSIALFVVSGSIRNLFSIDCVNIYLFPIFFKKFCPVEKCGKSPTLLILDSLTFKSLRIENVYSLISEVDADQI